jgi:bacillithiol biosynthesis deacetylase BshB1
MNILTLAIHPDDIELGCGGTVALAALQGHQVTLVDLSPGESSSNGTPEERTAEARKAAAILGAKQRLNVGLPDCAIQSEDPGQTRAVVDIIRSVRPDLVLIPHKEDPHPDHASGGALIERAIYLAGIQGYAAGSEACSVRSGLVYMGRLDFEPDFIVDITPTFSMKMDAVRAHRSQFIRDEGRNPTSINSPDFLQFLEARSSSYGYRAGARYGEPFLSWRPVALKDFAMFES